MLTGGSGISPKPIFEPSNAEMLAKEIITCFNKIVYQVQDAAYVGRKIQDIVFWLCELSSTKKSLLISGNAGSGKSTLSKALREAISVTSYDFSTYTISAKSLKDIYKKREENDTWERINKGKLLFIDDFGMEEDWVNEFGTKTQPMALLIHNRYDANLTTIITTNLTAEQMAKKYDDRIMDRLNGYAKMLYNHISFRRL